MSLKIDLIASLQLSEAARDFRLRHIGGSDANIIMSGDDSRILRLWEEKTGKRKPEDLTGELRVVMGQYTEALNVAWYEKNTGDTVSARGKSAASKTHEWMSCTLDGICLGGDAVYEAKHTGGYDFASRSPKTIESLASYYAPQLHHNMLVCGLNLAILSAFLDNSKWDHIRVEKDPFYCDALMEAESRFWLCVQRDTPPVDIPAPPPPPKFEKMRSVDMDGNNRWASAADCWLTNREAAAAFESSRKDLKSCLDPDVGKAYGHGVVAVRSANGAITIREHKE